MDPENPDKKVDPNKDMREILFTLLAGSLFSAFMIIIFIIYES